MYEFVCLNCGKKRVVGIRHGCTPKFCDRECWREHNEKKRAAKAEKKKNSYYLTPPITPESQCRECEFGGCTGGIWCCEYSEKTEKARLAIHPGGLPNECQEFQPIKRKRRGGA